MKKFTVLLIAALLVLCPGCAGEPAVPALAREKLIVSAAESPEKELVFSITPEEFVFAFNSLCRSETGADYLDPLDEWLCLSYDSSPHSDNATAYYRFSEDERRPSEPTLAIYAAKNGGHIQELVLTFDDHGYQPELLEKYGQMCAFTLRTLLPELDEAAASELYAKLFAAADSYLADAEGEPAPSVLYYMGAVGLFGYYGEGTDNICIVPVTGNTLSELRESGCKLCDLGA